MRTAFNESGEPTIQSHPSIHKQTNKPCRWVKEPMIIDSSSIADIWWCWSWCMSFTTFNQCERERERTCELIVSNSKLLRHIHSRRDALHHRPGIRIVRVYNDVVRRQSWKKHSSDRWRVSVAVRKSDNLLCDEPRVRDRKRQPSIERENWNRDLELDSARRVRCKIDHERCWDRSWSNDRWRN